MVVPNLGTIQWPFLYVTDVTNGFHVDTDVVSATVPKGSCLLTERASFNTQQALLSYYPTLIER